MIDFSVVIPTNRYDSFLEESIDSILEDVSDSNDIEIIISCNGVDRSTIAGKLKDNYSSLSKIIILESSSGNISEALNFGIARARGRCIIRFDGDDLWNKGRFLKINQEFIKKRGENIFGTSNYLEIDQSGQVLGEGRRLRNPSHFLRRPFKSLTAHPAIFFSKDLWEMSQYESELAGIEDVDFMYRLLEIVHPSNFISIDDNLISYRKHSNQYTFKNRYQQKVRLARLFYNKLYFWEKTFLAILDSSNSLYLKSIIVRALWYSLKI